MTLVDAFRRAILGLLFPKGTLARVMILNFHRVPKEVDTVSPGSVTGAIFAQQIGWLKELCNIIPSFDSRNYPVADVSADRRAVEVGGVDLC